MFKRIAAAVNAACSDDLDRWIQSLIERVDIGERSWFDILTAYATEAVFRAELFNRHPLKFVNCVNSIGNGMYIEDESVVIRPKNGFGGIGGQYIKPTALANVHAFYQRLDPSIHIIGTGGVYSGRDAFEHILCGASMVQIGTALHQQGVGIFERISLELKAIMAQKGYEKLEDIKGKLKYLA